jgi:ring-1,2-phenylacetyl-CoA epoxidase subunit PaaD
MDAAALDRDAILRVLDGVMDPEVPVLSVVELGVVRDVRIEGDEVTVVLTPTYSGCPAMHVMEADIVRALRSAGVDSVRVKTVYAPAWTSDWIPEAAREKLRAYGIAPPGKVSGSDMILIPLTRKPVATPCPYCGSYDTELRSEFGATACKSLHVCRSCRQPFEHFKAF